ncbi:BrnT family toxin [Acuticoccus sp. M5D2P5]|uniref:BrnT family toxin n=1 Tax=Acuticoccus kalidii TaxID=2910977 RepID=UPI001F33C7AD|nr:BrnT family toxin [Acuticoccus kalidii]MCF3934329.1 BrnT family toxin [Acuticoccus kalidii]
MMIVWDELKRQTNLSKHGLDFSDLDEEFFLSSTVVPVQGGRHMAIGRLADGAIAVVFAVLGDEGISVISMRPASKKERRLI